MKLWNIYHSEIPDFIVSISHTSPMQRLEGVGMNCGCEYTGFNGFRSIGAYSRLDHSIGAALIVWHFTGDIRQSVSALLHDIATPVFAHVIDFLNGDHVKQESTEDRTLEIINSSEDLVSSLSKLCLKPEDVSDYHLFPIADNDTPGLSSDRLEYTFGNLVNFRFGTKQTVRKLYSDLMAGINEKGEQELVFRNKDKACEFAGLSLRCSKIYSSDSDRYAMQRLAELIKGWIDIGIISREDLYGTEKEVLDKVSIHSEEWNRWLNFRAMSQIKTGISGPDSRIVQAKKRHINPYVPGAGRVSCFDDKYRMDLKEYLSSSFDYEISI